MKHEFNEIRDAFDFVSGSLDYLNVALICKETGRIYFRTEDDADDDFPDDPDLEHLLTVPSLREFDLGTRLVFRFVKDMQPQLYDDVREIFSSKGAYRRFHSFLDNLGHLQSWFDYREERTDQAIRRWCKENKIDLKDPGQN